MPGKSGVSNYFLENEFSTEHINSGATPQGLVHTVDQVTFESEDISFKQHNTAFFNGPQGEHSTSLSLFEQGDDRFLSQGTFNPQGSNVVNVVRIGDEPPVVTHVNSHASDDFLL